MGADTCILGDYQFDIYRMMRQTTGSDWQGFYPVTNLMVSSFIG